MWTTLTPGIHRGARLNVVLSKSLCKFAVNGGYFSPGASNLSPPLKLETSQVPQVAQTTQRILHLLRRVECFLWEVVKQANDLIIGTVLLCKSNEISFANRKWNMAQQLIQLSRIKAHHFTFLSAMSIIRTLFSVECHFLPVNILLPTGTRISEGRCFKHSPQKALLSYLGDTSTHLPWSRSCQ